MKIFAGLLLVLATSTLFQSTAEAARYAKQGADGQAHVAHTRRAPVIMHRAFPPYAGVHVYDRSGGEAGGASGNAATGAGAARRGR